MDCSSGGHCCMLEDDLKDIFHPLRIINVTKSEIELLERLEILDMERYFQQFFENQNYHGKVKETLQDFMTQLGDDPLYKPSTYYEKRLFTHPSTPTNDNDQSSNSSIHSDEKDAYDYVSSSSSDSD